MKKFHANDDSFICLNCGFNVPKLGYTSRDHCPKCLYSLHVDVNPGDRENKCLGLLEPIGIEKYKNTFKIVYRCIKCGDIHKNIIASDDNNDLIITLSSLPWKN